MHGFLPKPHLTHSESNPQLTDFTVMNWYMVANTAITLDNGGQAFDNRIMNKMTHTT